MSSSTKAMNALQNVILSLALGIFVIRPCDGAYFTSSPDTTSLHVNTDSQQNLWTVSAQCETSWDCSHNCWDHQCGYYYNLPTDCSQCLPPGSPDLVDGGWWWSSRTPAKYGSCLKWCPQTCYNTVTCNACSISETYSMFAMSDKTVYKKSCSDPLCTSCSAYNACPNVGNYYYSVSCSATNYNGYGSYWSATASGTYTLTFTDDIAPPFSYRAGSSIQIGRSMAGNGNLVNTIVSNPVDNTLDNDFVTFYRSSGSSFSWLTLGSSNGNIQVTSSVSTSAGTYSIVYCARNRRSKTKCETLSITVYDSYVSNSPAITSLHENTDALKNLWTITAKCDISYTCGGFTCSAQEDCNSCTVSNTQNFFAMSGTHTVYKKECLTPLCDTCSVGNYCANRGETYTYTVSCVRTNTFGYSGFTSGTATKTVSLSFFADVNPPFAYDSSIGNSINIGKGIPGTGQMVNRIFSNPEETTDDNDVPVFWRSSGDNPAWLTVVRVHKKKCLTPLCDTCSVGNYCANRGETYNYTVSCVRTNTFGYSGFTSGTATKTMVNRIFSNPEETTDDNDVPVFWRSSGDNPAWLTVVRAHDVHKKTCLKPLCEPCYISDFCVNEAETYNYTVDCVKTNYNSFSQFTTGHAVRTPSLYFYTDIIPPFKYDGK
ncbi:hypothetical protein DPMN_051174 [Dreissena polymorpha]|uniref:Uncharacterized protein n=1 Tax=Dreissena polymorpha TaxID=45954 RepID=A0A9D4CHE6_DREPO|nr:hypothetical protein DPMN_051174 [Dreissena polymorpha]